jgi:hypothetical protein
MPVMEVTNVKLSSLRCGVPGACVRGAHPLWDTLGVNDSGYEPNRAYSFFAVGGSRPFSRK